MRKYLPTLGELIDRLSIVQLKEVKIPQHKDEYTKEISDIVHDINEILKEKDKIDGEFIRFRNCTISDESIFGIMKIMQEVVRIKVINFYLPMG